MCASKRPNLARIALPLGLLLGARGGPQAQVPIQQALAQTVHGYEDGGAAGYVLLARLSQRFGFPQGVEIDGEVPGGLTSVRIADGTVADIVDNLVRRLPNYKWEIIDGVLNVMPQEHRDSVLDVRIHALHLRRCTPADFPRAIASVPEIKEWLVKNGAVEHTPVAVVGSVSLPGTIPRFSTDAKDRTLREILNILVKSHGLLRWAVTRYGEGGKYLSIVVE